MTTCSSSENPPPPHSLGQCGAKYPPSRSCAPHHRWNSANCSCDAPACSTRQPSGTCSEHHARISWRKGFSADSSSSMTRQPFARPFATPFRLVIQDTPLIFLLEIGIEKYHGKRWSEW